MKPKTRVPTWIARAVHEGHETDDGALKGCYKHYGNFEAWVLAKHAQQGTTYNVYVVVNGEAPMFMGTYIGDSYGDHE